MFSLVLERGFKKLRPRFFLGGFLQSYFKPSAPLTLGVKLEFQLLNRETLDLSSSSLEVLKILNESNSVKAEIYQSMIEIVTGICGDAHDLEESKASNPPPLWLLRENKWRVMRRGVKAELIVADDGRKKTVKEFLGWNIGKSRSFD